MRFLCVLVGALCTYSACAEVVELTVENFEHLTQASTGATTGDWFVEFYAPWCGHCKKLAPDWERLATALEGEINVAKVDCTRHQKLASRFGIKGFPSLVFFHHGKVYKHSGSRSLSALMDFAKGGYEKIEGTEVPPFPTIMDEVTKTASDIFGGAREDFVKGKYTSPRILMLLLPLIFIILTLALVLTAPREPQQQDDPNAGVSETKASKPKED